MQWTQQPTLPSVPPLPSESVEKTHLILLLLLYHCPFLLPPSSRPIGDQQRASELQGISVFETKSVLTGKKRKRKEKGDPEEVEGYMGPGREFEDQVKVAKPTQEQMAILEEQFGEKQKAKQKKEEDTIEESTTLHGR